MSNTSFWPLSGDVMQTWASLLKSMSQVGLVNIINETNAKDPDLERKIVTESYSYGSQLGRINDALDVLIRKSKSLDGNLASDEQKAIADFSRMVADIAEIKVGGLPLSEDDQDYFIHRMKILRKENLKVFRDVKRHLLSLQERIENEIGE
jgi:hypothetical protein